MNNKRREWGRVAGLLLGIVVLWSSMPEIVQSQTKNQTRQSSQPKPAVQSVSGQNELANQLIQSISKPELQPRIVQAVFDGVEQQASVFSTSLQEFPRSGSQYIALSTGLIEKIPDVATTFSSVNLGGVSIPGGSPDGFNAFDVATLRVTINLDDLPQEEDPRLVFRYKFCSEEPPTFWGSEFQDYFTAFVINSNGEPVENIALLPNGEPFTIDNARPFMNQVSGSHIDPEPPFPTPNDVVFNSCTGIHTTDFDLSDWVDQEITLEFRIGDVSDGILDSGVFIDGLEIQMGILPDFRIDRVEFNQASQSFENGQNVAASQLVSGTRYGTGVRVYVVGEDNADNPQAVSARLHLHKDGSPVSGSPFQPVPLRIEPVLNPSRTAMDANERPTETLQFNIPRSATLEPGTYNYYIEVDPDNEVDERENANNRFPAFGFNSVTFNERETLKVLLLRVTPVDGDGNVVNAYTQADLDKYIEQRVYAYKILPRHVDFWFNTMDWNLDKTLSIFWWEKNIGDLSTKDGRDELFSTILDRMNNSPNNYHSVIAMLPCGTDLYKNANGWGYIGSPGGIVRTCSNSTLTHEIAHNWLPSSSFSAPDEDHDPTNSGDDGFWVGPDMKLKLNKANILNVGSNDPWVSPTSYKALFENDALINSQGMSNQPKKIIASGVQDNALNISGWFDEEDELVIKPLHSVETSSFTANNPEGSFIIELLDENEEVLESLQFDPPMVFEHGLDPSPGPFTVTMAKPETFSSVVFRPSNAFKFGNNPLQINTTRTISVSENGPDISVVSPGGGETADDMLLIEWEAEDPDGDDLFYTVQYASDGVNFETISGTITETSYDLDTSGIPGGKTARVRIIASDGVNTAASLSNEFSVASKPPDPSILTPESGSAIPVGAPAGFEGDAFDAEDGEIPPEQLMWSSDIDGMLGTGESISTTQLSAGTHTITLSATDSEENTGTTSVSFIVVDTTPDAPTDLQAEAGNRQVTLQWSASSGEHVEGYRVYWGTSEGLYGADVNVQTQTSHTITNLNNGTAYYFAVTSYDVIGNESDFSAEAIAEPSLIPLLATPENGSDQISVLPTLSWSDEPEADHYQLQISDTEEFDSLWVFAEFIENSFYEVEDSLSFSSTFYWRVRAVTDTTENSWSTAWSFTTEGNIPATVTLLDPPDGSEDVELLTQFTWQTAERAEHYRFQLGTDPEFASEIIVDSTSIESTEITLIDDLDPVTEYHWRVRGQNDADSGEWSPVWSFTTGVVTAIHADEIPVNYTLLQNYPNPFNPTTIIEFGIPEGSDVQLSVYNMLGQRVAVLMNEYKNAGWHRASFDASSFSSGIYFYRLQAGDFISTKKLTLIK